MAAQIVDVIRQTCGPLLGRFGFTFLGTQNNVHDVTYQKCDDESYKIGVTSRGYMIGLPDRRYMAEVVHPSLRKEELGSKFKPMIFDPKPAA